MVVAMDDDKLERVTRKVLVGLLGLDLYSDLGAVDQKRCRQSLYFSALIV